MTQDELGQEPAEKETQERLFSLRLSAAEYAYLEQLALQTGESKAEVMRRALKGVTLREKVQEPHLEAFRALSQSAAHLNDTLRQLYALNRSLTALQTWATTRDVEVLNWPDALPLETFLARVSPQIQEVVGHVQSLRFLMLNQEVPVAKKGRGKRQP